jgi:hypothetical protein
MLAVPVRLEPLVFCTVKLRSTVVPVVTLPKAVVVEGLIVRSGWATPLVAAEHALSLPELSTAVTRTKYVVPAVRAVTPVATVCPLVGLDVGDDTAKNVVLGQLGDDVPR